MVVPGEDVGVDASPAVTVAAVGAVAVAFGVVFDEAFGASTAATAAGIGMVAAGGTYAVSEGGDAVRTGLAVLALVASQLLRFGGTVRLAGAVAGIGVVAGVVYSTVRA